MDGTEPGVLAGHHRDRARADLELRSDADYFVGSELKVDAFDLDSVVTHEVGHIFGIAHTNETDAVMFPTPGTPATCGDPDVTHGCSVGPASPLRASTPSWLGALATLALAFSLYARRIRASASRDSSEI